MIERLFAYLGASRAVLAISLARMADAMGNSILFIILPIYVADLPQLFFDLPVPVLVGILISLYGLVNSMLQPITGALSDHFGRRKPLILTGLILMGIGTLLFAFTRNYSQLLILRSLQGIGVAVTIPASMALMAGITIKETRGGAMGVYSTLRVIGFALGPLIGGFIQVNYGFKATFITGAGFLFLAVLLVQFWVEEVPVPGAVRKERKRAFRVFDRSLLTPGILSAALATFLIAASFSMVTTLENEFNAKLNIDAFYFSLGFSALMIGRVTFQVPLGRLTDFIGRKPIVLLGLILMGPVTALLGEVNNMTQFVILRVFQGVASAAVAAPAFAIAGDMTTSGGEGRQMAVLTMGFGLGLTLGPFLAGILAVLFFELPFLVFGIAAWVTALIVFRSMPETVERRAVLFKEKTKK
jgi:MFS family permease